MVSIYIANELPPTSKKEIFRYVGIKGDAPENIAEDILRCYEKAKKVVTPKACFMRVKIKKEGERISLGDFCVSSKSLYQNLENCDEVFLFSATLGVGIDILINRYSRISPVSALYFQGIGTAMIESFCDFLCDCVFTGENECLKPRFSPGYGDLDISCQKDFIDALNCNKNIGVYLTDGGLMTPSKSVTAIVGITNGIETKRYGKCEKCEKKNCEFRR